MKKIIILVLGMFILVGSLFSQEINGGFSKETLNVKELLPNMFLTIFVEASLVYADDYSMVVWQINNECEALTKVSMLIAEDEYGEIVNRVLLDNIPIGCNDFSDFAKVPYNWALIWYELNKNIKMYNLLLSIDEKKEEEEVE